MLPATGFIVAVTAERRASELATILERQGATVILAPAIRIVPVGDDAELSLGTRALLDQPPEILVATTGIGFRGWMEAAAQWGLAEQLTTMLGGVRILTRGPKAKGAVRGAGLREEWSPASESCAEVLNKLLQEDLRGVRIAVQLHGSSLPEFIAPLRQQGAIVIELSPYRWLPPLDTAPLRRLVNMVVNYQVDAVTFTSAPAALMFLQMAEDESVLPALIQALEKKVMVICVGPVTGEVFNRINIPTTQPSRSRLGDLGREVVEQLQARGLVIESANAPINIRDDAPVLAEEVRSIPPALTANVYKRPRATGTAPNDIQKLTDQERKVLERIGLGLTNRQIANSMFLAEKTVKNYVSSLLTKLGLESRTQAAVLAVRLGLARP